MSEILINDLVEGIITSRHDTHESTNGSNGDKTLRQIQRQTSDVKTCGCVMCSHSSAVKITKQWTQSGQTIANTNTASVRTTVTAGADNDSDRTDQSVNRHINPLPMTATITGADPPSMAYECPNEWCGQRFPTRALLDTHWAATHRTTRSVVTVDSDEEPDNPLPADNCECGRRCWSLEGLIKHRECHLFRTCPAVKRGVRRRPRKAAVKAITAMTAGDPLKLFHCLSDGCGKRFHYSEGLRAHSRVMHPEDQQIPCGYRQCGHRYDKISDLRAHRLAAGHMGRQQPPPVTHLRVAQCRAVGCGKWFTNVDRMRWHRRVDHGLDTYRCVESGCHNHLFDTLRDLEAHKRTAHNNGQSSAVTITTAGASNRFNCGCGQWFATMKALARHRKSYRCRTDGPNRSVPTPSGGQLVVNVSGEQPEDKSAIAAAVVAEMSRQRVRVEPIGEVSVAETSALFPHFEYQSQCILTADIKTETPDICSSGDQSVGTVDDVKPVIIASTAAAAEGVRPLRGRPQKSISTEAVASAPTDQVFVYQSDSDSRQTVDPKASSSDQKSVVDPQLMDSLLSQDMSVAETSVLFPEFEYESHGSVTACAEQSVPYECPNEWCGQQFPTRALLDEHWVVSHRTVNIVVEVDVCQEVNRRPTRGRPRKQPTPPVGVVDDVKRDPKDQLMAAAAVADALRRGGGDWAPVSAADTSVPMDPVFDYQSDAILTADIKTES